MSKTNNKFILIGKKNIVFFLLYTVLFIGLNILPGFKNFIEKYENLLIDFRFQITQSPVQTKDIVVVDIDASSINKLSLWPFPRSYWGTAIQNLNNYGAKVIGIDVLFDTQSLNKDEDLFFSKSLSNYSNVVLASRKYIEKKQHYELELWSNPIPIFSKHSFSGFVNFPFDKDGIIRKSYTSLKSTKTTPPISFDALIISLFNKTYPKISYPQHIENDGTYMINYCLTKGFKRIPFFLILEDRPPDPRIFHNKIVLIGSSDPSLNDLYFTPLGLIPGVDIHAYNIMTLLENNYIFKASPLISYSLLFLISFCILIFVMKFTGFIGFLITLAVIFVHSMISMLLFKYTFYLIPWAIFVIGIFCAFIFSIIVKVIFEEKQKTYIKEVFSQYVAPEVVNTLINSPKALSLGGEKKEITIFFSDIRSFTSMSEKHPPELIVSQLNDYLDAMTLCIFKWKGTLDKYVGDEIMAIWGAPLDQPDHARRAVQCGWEQLTILKDLQKKWESENKPIFDIGIGINTGTVVVGNIGSSVHKDFTVIGDDVNYAARLESITRDFSDESHICRFIISESTYQVVKDICKVKPLGEVSVKGKEISKMIYEVIDVSFETQS